MGTDDPGGVRPAWVLERTYYGPLGGATGTERLQIRLSDLLVHGWRLLSAFAE
jgi:hypothetical protein